MTNEVDVFVPGSNVKAGLFRPESLAHFKDVAKGIAELLERPLQKCQDDLARIYGYSGLHELQQVLKHPGIAGPFESRYGFFDGEDAAVVMARDRRIFAILFGPPQGMWRDRRPKDRHFLVFELGLFRPAAMQRSMASKVFAVATDSFYDEDWPLIDGMPLGLRSWMALNGTEPYQLAEDWQSKLPAMRYTNLGEADIRFQHRLAAEVQTETIFRVLAPRIESKKPAGMGRVNFAVFSEGDPSGVTQPSGEAYCFQEWVLHRAGLSWKSATEDQLRLLRAFLDTPSLATAAACDLVAHIKNPVVFRDRWAFECFKAEAANYDVMHRAFFASHEDAGHLFSLLLNSDATSELVREDFGADFWEVRLTLARVTAPTREVGQPVLQPVIHGAGSLVTPFDSKEMVSIAPEEWLIAHDCSEFASEAAAHIVESVYFPAIGLRKLDFIKYGDGQMFSILEVDELVIAADVDSVLLRDFFDRFLAQFSDLLGHLDAGLGGWVQTLELVYGDDDANSERNMYGEYDEYIPPPRVMVVNVRGCAATTIRATTLKGAPVEKLIKNSRQQATAAGAALAEMILEATKDLPIDVVVYDKDLHDSD